MSVPNRKPALPARLGGIDGEIAFHIEQLTETYLEQGLTPFEARRQALLDFGGREQIRQQVREVYVYALWEGVMLLVRAAVRFLRHAPAFSVAAVITLALGIGANSAVFSMLDAVVLRPLPFPHGDELMLLEQRNDHSQDGNRSLAPARLEDWNHLATAAFQGVTGYYKDDFTETSGPLPERLTGELVAPRFLRVMGVSPALGRDFSPSEEHFGGPGAVLISYRLWQGQFRGDPAVLGKNLHVGVAPLSIVGVMPKTFSFPLADVDLWTPSPPDAPYAGSRESTWFTAIGRLRPGVSVAQARAILATVQSQLGAQFPQTDADLATVITPLKETVVGGVRRSLWLLYGSVSLLLLIACSNLAALLLARTADREHEISVRYSLGASRLAIVLQLLAEVLALALLGSGLGLVVAAAALHGFHLLAQALPRVDEIHLNGRVLIYSIACAVITALLCGLYPALRGTRQQLAQSLAATGRTQSGSRNSMQWILVGVQVMFAVVLLTAAGLLLRSLRELGRVSPGFDPSHVLAFQVSGAWGETADMGRLAGRVDRTLDALRSMPGVEAAATSASLPGVPGLYQEKFRIDGHGDASRPILADSRFVSSGYFGTMHIPVLLGEACRGHRTDVLVNRSFVSRYFNGAPALGHTLLPEVGSFSLPGQIRGIVGDAREQGLNTEPVPTVYFCTSAPTASPNYFVRTRGEAAGMSEAVRRKVHEVEPSRSVFAMVPLQQHLENAFSQDRLRTVLLLGFASTAIALACVGLYGTLNYLGRVRRRETALRLTLGATRAEVGVHFLLQGLRVTVLGCAAGALISVAIGSLFAKMLYGVSALDAPTYLGVSLFVLAVATVASALPARRAALVQPAEALRQG